jgi:predicted dehydrogenase
MTVLESARPKTPSVKEEARRHPKGVIVGVGRAGSYLHFGAMKAAGADVIAFVDSNEAQARKVAENLQVDSVYGTLEKALSANPGLDFVDICSSSSSHFPLAKLALEAGCNVLIEKPITENLEELDALKSLATGRGRLVCAVHNHKYYPGMVELRERVRAGEAGEVIGVHREMSFNHQGIRMMEEGHWAHKIPGGRLFEANPHNLYLLYGLLGPMELVSVQARKASSRWPHARFDEFHATLRTGQATVSIKMSMHCEAEGYGKHGPNFIVVVGTKKTLIADYSQVVDMRDAGRRSPISALLKRIGRKAKTMPELRDREGNPINLGTGSGHYWMIDRFIGHIAGKYAEEPVPFEEAYFVQKMNLAMGHLAEEGGRA